MATYVVIKSIHKCLVETEDSLNIQTKCIICVKVSKVHPFCHSWVNMLGAPTHSTLQMNLSDNSVYNLFAGDLSRDVSFILHVTLRLLWLSDESKLLSCRSDVSAALPVSRLHAQITEGFTLPVSCPVHEKFDTLSSSACWRRPGQSTAYQHCCVARQLSHSYWEQGCYQLLLINWASDC